MGNLTREDVLKLARLARLDLSDEEVDQLVEELSEILQYVQQLQDIDASGLSPTNQVTGLVNIDREDVVADYGYEAIELLKNVPHTKGDLIQVKRMIG
jgi:aspartyl-tRNA(Asn)/glutamyl-tRNA(Gln) amidotransferase subunit C